VLDEVEATACVDRSRVFATGFSAGGNIALVAACALPERIAAVAPVSAAFQPGECEGAPPMPILAFQGDDDLIVPAEGRDTPDAGTLLAARDVLADQADRNGCDGEPTTTTPADGVRELTWEGCDAPTSLIELADHGHAWPGHPMPFPRDVLVGLFTGGDGRPPSPLMEAIGETPEAMADNVLLTSDAIDATDRILAFFDEVRPTA
jgi:poly(3-hydroxybutyrate) depolymerase